MATKTSRIPLNLNFLGETAFLEGIFCLEYPNIHVSQTTDFHFANYRFPFCKLQIPISQTTDFHFVSFHFVLFHFVSFHFVSQTTVSPLSRNSQKRLEHKENQAKYRKITRKPWTHVRFIILIYRTLAIKLQHLTILFKHSTIRCRQQFPAAFLFVVTQNENTSLLQGALCNNTKKGFVGDYPVVL